jgi:glycosyltransferase involved in cell wall biosynthesis
VKVLVIGCAAYARETDSVAKSLEAAGAAVALRFIDSPAAEGRHPGGCDATLQVVPPADMHYVARGGLNVGVLLSRPADTRPGPLDFYVVPCPGWSVAHPAAVVPLATNPTRFLEDYAPPTPVVEFGRGRLLFYSVGPWTRRHNAAGLLKAFFAEFRAGEPVGLVLHAAVPGQTPRDAHRTVMAEVDQVRAGCGLPSTPPVLVSTEPLSDEAVCGLHRACDVFVEPSYGYAWSFGAYDALGFGKTPIVTAAGGCREFVCGETGWLTPARKEPVFGDDGSTVRQTWDAPDLLVLCEQMRQAFEDAALRERRALRARDVVESYSHGPVGARLLRVLSDGQEVQGHSGPGLA